MHASWTKKYPCNVVLLRISYLIILTACTFSSNTIYDLRFIIIIPNGTAFLTFIKTLQYGSFIFPFCFESSSTWNLFHWSLDSGSIFSRSNAPQMLPSLSLQATSEHMWLSNCTCSHSACSVMQWWVDLPRCPIKILGCFKLSVLMNDDSEPSMHLFFSIRLGNAVWMRYLGR